ncbi:DUF2393 family protein [Helicobacter salomonis]|uniref:DUF2393 family protein n=1 Tax=Helicobacter salomonis TaxID=56878 RepID=UPI000CF1BC8B|nr:DUF2393 family protein [Helicobacter salomonis]
MSALQPILEHLFEILHYFWDQTSPLALWIFGGHYALFIILFSMGIVFKGVLSALCHVLSFIALFGAPFGVHYATEEQFYKIQTTIEHAAALVYTDAFVAQVKIKNEGRLDMKRCVLRLDVFNPFHNKVQEILSHLLFAKSYIKVFHTPLVRQQEYTFNWSIDNYPYRKNPFKLSANCY